MQIIKYLSLLTATLSFCSLCIISCESNEIEGVFVDDVATSHSELSYYDAMLTVEVNFSAWDSSSFPDLCLGPQPNPRCYNLPLDAAHCTASGGINECQFNSINLPQFSYNGSDDADPFSAAQPEDDHPFVDYPDDWDNISIRNNSSSSNLVIADVMIRLEVRLSDSTGGYSDYTFVDKDNLFDTALPNGSIRLDSYVTERRECVFRTAYCGSGDINVCNDTPNALCANGPEALIADVDVENIPIPLREALDDLGQPGMWKFAPLDRTGNKAGCYGPLGYYLGNFTGNIDYSCQTDSQVCGPCNHVNCPVHFCQDNVDNDGDGQTDCDDSECDKYPLCGAGGTLQGYCVGFELTPNPPHTCSYFKYWGDRGKAQSLAWIDQYIASERAAIVLFDEDAAGNRTPNIPGGNPNGYVICTMSKDGVPNASQTPIPGGLGQRWSCNNPTDVYTPKAADYFQISRQESSAHLMLWMGAPPIGVDASLRFGGAIMDKGNPFGAHTRLFDIDRTQFYFGNTDFDNAGFRATQPVPLYPTLL